MSLLLNGAKTMTIAGTEMQCLEIYTGESYTLPLNFTDSTGNSTNCYSWTISTTSKFYNVSDVNYSVNSDAVVLGNLTLNSPQPNANAYTVSTAFTNANIGLGYLYIGNNITNTANVGIPQVTLANNAANSTLVIVTLGVQRTDSLSGLVDFNREPLGFIVRYQ
jgi:hypothetical protein